MSQLSGIYEQTVNGIDVVWLAYGQALADEPKPASFRQGIIAVMTKVLGHAHNIAPDAIEIDALDIMPIPGDESFAWECELWWRIWCDHCGMTAIEQDKYDSFLCQHHFDEALAQDIADLENDDRAIGMQP